MIQIILTEVLTQRPNIQLPNCRKHERFNNNNNNANVLATTVIYSHKGVSVIHQIV